MTTVIIANPKSGSFNEPMLSKCADLLHSQLGNVSVKYTETQGNAGVIASESGADMVIAAGGDGLINEIAAGIAGKDILFSALPFGTVNVFCREFGIPLNPIKAVKTLKTSRTRKISLGFLDDHPFVLMCGFGYDARVVKQVVSKGYSKHKTIAHCLEGVSSLIVQYPELTLNMNEQTICAYHIIISLARLYAGNFTLSNLIKNDVLNIFVQQNKHLHALLYTTLSVAVGRGFPGTPHYANMAKISGTDYCQLDGEYTYIGSVQHCISIKHSALTIAY